MKKLTNLYPEAPASREPGNATAAPVFNIGKSSSLNKWRSNSLLHGLTPIQLDRLEHAIQYKRFKPGDYIIHEGEEGDCLFLVEKGTVEIRKDLLTLAHKKEGEHFGTMALIDNSPRSADVIASGDALVASLYIDKIRDASSQDIFNVILLNHVKEQQASLRNTNDVAVAEVRQKLAEAQKRLDAGEFFVALVFCLVVYQFMLGIFIEYGSVLRDRAYLELITPAFTLLLGITALVYAIQSRKNHGVNLEQFGLTWKNWKAHLPQTLVWTLGMVAVITLLKWVATYTIPFYMGKPVWDMSHLSQFDWQMQVMIYTLYALLIPVQELIARGVIQSSLQRVLTGNLVTARAILLSNLMFSSFHLYMDVRFAVMTFFPGLVWGMLYARQDSLAGVCISHIIIGLYALKVLGVY